MTGKGSTQRKSFLLRQLRWSGFGIGTIVVLSLPAFGIAQPVIEIDDSNNQISTDVTWPAGATVNVHSPVAVSGTAFLRVERGVRVRFDPDTYINVEGGFDVAGTEAQPALFTSASPRPAAGDWAGILLWLSSEPPSISYAIVEYTVWGVYAGHTSPVIENTVIRDVAGNSGVSLEGSGDPPGDVLIIRRCVIERVRGNKGQDGAHGGNGGAGTDGGDSINPFANGENGGNGASGHDGEPGFGGAYVSGVEVHSATAVIEHTVIRDIVGGVGGTGGRGGRGGRGGHGGDGATVVSQGTNGGFGGNAGPNGNGGEGGRGGNAYGVRLLGRSGLSVSSSLIARITGGRGGEGGPADLGGNAGGDGGGGGNGIGIFADGGDGGDGGNGGYRGRGGAGGTGGDAHAIHIPTAGSSGRIEFNTLSDIRRGPEGPGGIVSGAFGSGGTGGAGGNGGSQGRNGAPGSNGGRGGAGSDGSTGFPGTSYGLLAANADVAIGLTNNIFAFGDTDGGAGVSVAGAALSSRDHNCIFGFQSAYVGTSPGLHDVFVDPGFADAGNGNYRLRPDSACIDAAFPSVIPGLADLDGEARPYDVPGVGSDGPGQGFDIGCYEYAPFTGDLNQDGLLNWKDLFSMSREWRMDPALEADLDGDGKVDGGDIATMMRRWMGESARR